MNQTLDWKRVRGALFQLAQRRGISETKVETTLTVLPQLIEMSGPYSQSRKAALRVGSLLLQTDSPDVIVPSCPAYPNREGRYHRVWKLGSGISLLTRLHLPFLHRLVELVPGTRITILVADFEANDWILRRSTGLTRTAFLEKVRRTAAATYDQVKEFGWEVQLFSTFFPTFEEKRNAAIQKIDANPQFFPQIRADTHARQGFYRLYYPNAKFQNMADRTTKAAAEYLVLGQEAAERQLLIVNHTTTSLAWYLRTEAAFLNNPIRTY